MPAKKRLSGAAALKAAFEADQRRLLANWAEIDERARRAAADPNVLAVCRHCGQEKPRKDFPKARAGGWTLCWCRKCHAEATQAWREAHRDELNQRRREAYRRGAR
jgi:hypothetical protein